MNISRKTFAVSVSILALVSCQGNLSREWQENVMRFRTATDAPTKSACNARGRMIISDSGDMSLEEFVSDIPTGMNCTSASAATKGSVITTGSLNSAGNSFVMDAWVDGNKFIDGETASNTAGEWAIGEGKYRWYDGLPTVFWCRKCEYGTLSLSGPSGDNLQTLDFDYSLPADLGNDAGSLKDFIMSYNCEVRNVDEDGHLVAGQSQIVSLDFFHPLAAVKFSLGRINTVMYPSTDVDYTSVDIRSITMDGVCSKGHFTATGTSDGKCSFNCTPDESSRISFRQTTNVSRTSVESTSGMFLNDYVFFMIPQDLTGVTVTVVFTKPKSGEPEPRVFARKVSLDGGWESNRYYTYRINANIFVGGEEVKIPEEELEHSDGISIDDGKLNLSASGKDNIDEFVAPLDVTNVKIIKVTWNQEISDKPGKAERFLYLENAVKDPSDPTGQTYLPGLTTDDPSLVNIYKTSVPNWKDYWPDGYDGRYRKTVKGQLTETATYYFFLNGEFSKIKIHFGYVGNTGGGSSTWTVTQPVFNITDVVEYVASDVE